MEMIVGGGGRPRAGERPTLPLSTPLCSMCSPVGAVASALWTTRVAGSMTVPACARRRPATAAGLHCADTDDSAPASAITSTGTPSPDPHLTMKGTVLLPVTVNVREPSWPEAASTAALTDDTYASVGTSNVRATPAVEQRAGAAPSCRPTTSPVVASV